MQKILLIFIFLLIQGSSSSQQNFTTPVIRSFIDSLYQVDQQVQLEMISAYQRGAGFDSLKIYEQRNSEVFTRHIPLLKNIITGYGYPTIEKAGVESSGHFFVLVRHSDKDLAFQASMLSLVKAEVDKKAVSGSEYAYLYDRVQVNSGKPQLYGTQLNYENGTAVPKKLKKPSTVNKRRRLLGMQTLEKYLAMSTKLHQSMNQQ